MSDMTMFSATVIVGQSASLMDDDHARRAAVEGRGETRRLAVDKDLARIRLTIASEDAHEGGFSGAVLAAAAIIKAAILMFVPPISSF
jgi:hypothetical protein